MVKYEFEGYSEADIINKAVKHLGLDVDQIDLEIIERKKVGFIFKKELIRANIYVEEKKQSNKNTNNKIEENYLELVKTFISQVLKTMNFDGKIVDVKEEDGKTFIILDSQEDINLLIGKEGKNLNALQTLTTVYLNKISDKRNNRLFLDIEGYRGRREEQVVKNAIKLAHQVKKTKKVKVLPPLNPFERRMIHMALRKIKGISTYSEGEGTLKCIKISYRSHPKKK